MAIKSCVSYIIWNLVTMFQRVQNAMNVFPYYHGLDNDGGLSAYPTSSFNRSDEVGNLKIAVYFNWGITKPMEKHLLGCCVFSIDKNSCPSDPTLERCMHRVRISW